MGGILGTLLAQNRPDEVHGLLLLAPTLKLDGWSMPWYSRVINYIVPTPIPLELELPEHEPYGIKDDRVRALIVNAMKSGDASQAGVFSTPVRSFANFNVLVKRVKKRLGTVRQPALIVHPRHDDMASLKNAQYLQTHLAGLVDTLILDDSYHIVTLDQQRHLVVDRTVSFVARVASGRAAIVEREAARERMRLGKINPT
jgi:carboxylesterase